LGCLGSLSTQTIFGYQFQRFARSVRGRPLSNPQFEYERWVLPVYGDVF